MPKFSFQRFRKLKTEADRVRQKFDGQTIRRSPAHVDGGLLEIQLQGSLLGTCRNVTCTRDLAKDTARKGAVGRTKIRMVESIEHLPSELQAVALPEAEALGQSHIPSVRPGTRDDIPSS